MQESNPSKPICAKLPELITDCKEEPGKTQLSEADYKQIINSVRDTIYLHSLDGKILFINKVVEEYGFRPDEVIGKNLLNFIPKKYWAKLLLQIAKLSRGQRIEGELQVKTPVGLREAEYRSNPVYIGNKVTNGLAVIRDITDRKKIENQLIESQQKLEELFNANPEASVFLDRDFRVIKSNSQFDKLFGYKAEEIVGKMIADLIDPPGAEKESLYMQQEITKGHYEAITQRKRKDSSLISVFVSGSSILVKNKSIGIVIVYKDISAIVQTQNELNEALLKAELLNEKLSVIGGFTRHDVRNKIMGIKGNIYLAKKHSDDKEHLLLALERINLVTENIIDILNFAKDFEMIGTQQLISIDVGKAIDHATSLFPDLKQVQVINECHGYIVNADQMVTTIFHNLIDNSLKYGEKITQIRIYIETEQQTTKIIYTDNGIGIDKETKKQLFKKGVGRGTGYGLYLIKRTCEIYGWSIKETGHNGKGVCFQFIIPPKR